MIDAVVTFVVLVAFGAPLPAALSAVALVAGFVPYLGAIIGGLVIFLATLALAGVVPATAVVLATLVAWLVAGRLLERTTMSTDTDVNPVLVLIAIPAGFAMLGVLGVLALLPMTVFGLGVSRAVVAALGVAPGDGTDEPGASAPEADANGVPLWLERLAQWSWRGLVLAVLGWLVVATIDRIPAVVAPVALSLVAAATMLPVVAWLERRGWGRGVASGAAMLVVSGITIAACVAATAVTVNAMGDIIDTAAAGAGRFDLEWLRDAIISIGGSVRVDVAGVLASSALLVLDIVLALLVCFFLLRDGPGWWAAGTERLATGRREPVQLAGHRAVDILAGYMGGTAVISLFGAVTSGLIMVILGLPLALPIVVIGFFFGFIPYLGSFLTTAIAVLVTFALGTPATMAVMLVFTVVFNIVQGNIVTPLVYGRGLALHPAVVLMAIPVGGELAGMLGMFLVVPVAAMAAATWRLIPRVIDGSGLPDDATATPALPEPAAAG
ncbi:MAG: AI-2E family transporter [Chloroflexota bacterium]